LPWRPNTAKETTETAKKMILNLAANRQELFTWQFGRQEIYGNGKMAKAPRKCLNRQAN